MTVVFKEKQQLFPDCPSYRQRARALVVCHPVEIQERGTWAIELEAHAGITLDPHIYCGCFPMRAFSFVQASFGLLSNRYMRIQSYAYLYYRTKALSCEDASFSQAGEKTGGTLAHA